MQTAAIAHLESNHLLSFAIAGQCRHYDDVEQMLNDLMLRHSEPSQETRLID